MSLHLDCSRILRSLYHFHYLSRAVVAGRHCQVGRLPGLGVGRIGSRRSLRLWWAVAGEVDQVARQTSLRQ
jgi:hypothetical protein